MPLINARRQLDASNGFKKFDSSLDHGKPFETVIGRGRVIRGWDEAVPQMSIGEKARLTITGDYAYGERGYPGLVRHTHALEARRDLALTHSFTNSDAGIPDPAERHPHLRGRAAADQALSGRWSCRMLCGDTAAALSWNAPQIVVSQRPTHSEVLWTNCCRKWAKILVFARKIDGTRKPPTASRTVKW